MASRKKNVVSLAAALGKTPAFRELARQRPLRDRTDEELRETIRDGLSDVVMELLVATKSAHSSSRQHNHLAPKFVQAMGEDLSDIGEALSGASESYRRILAAFELLVSRQEEERKAKRVETDG